MRSVALVLATLAPMATAASPSLLPLPASIQMGTGSLRISHTSTVAVAADAPGAARAAALLGDMLKRSRGFDLKPASNATIRFVRTAGGKPESYRLTVDSVHATITAPDDAGLFYGAITLWQLVSADGTIPAVTIDDAPRFGWRGLMLDSARHYQSPAFIKRLLEWMALAKLNRFHWHLVDDQGWRIPIDKYPRLTAVGGWRVPASVPPAPALPREGGVYSKAEIRDIVAFAAARNITVIPEIEMPGHALAAIRAYPKLGMGVTPPPGIESDWGVFPYLYNTDDATFAFLEDVLAEVIDLFPGPYIHIGGDEAVKDQWHSDPATQARIKALGLKDEEALQGWFIARIGKFLTAHGRKLIGWDEILAGGVPESATVMSWQGVDGAAKAAAAGHDAILAAGPTLYFDNIEGAAEPIGRGHVVSLADVYGFDPLPASIPTAREQHILGLQGTLWTEHMRSEARVAHQAFPRALAVAELGWSAAGSKDYPGFERRAAAQVERLRAFELTQASTASFMPTPKSPLTTCEDKLVLGLEDDYPAAGPRATFKVDILAPCWKWAGAPVAGAKTIEVDVGQLPFNYQIGNDRDAIRFRPPATPDGELEVRDGCDGDRLAVLPLAPAVRNPGVSTLRAPLPLGAGAAGLCLTFTARGSDPIWAVAAVRLVP
ncbi:beta-N-acetylhexosaminidase [Sphingosinicellaceae bacterium]|nr:beta-N-acetylhexosaminidase [Sphingosinicellaceae bacterium]